MSPPVRLLKTVRLLETLEYAAYFSIIGAKRQKVGPAKYSPKIAFFYMSFSITCLAEEIRSFKCSLSLLDET